MNIVINYLKNIGFLIFLMINEIAVFQIARYMSSSDGVCFWERGHPYYNATIILTGALLYSMYDWWQQRKSESEQDE